MSTCVLSCSMCPEPVILKAALTANAAKNIADMFIEGYERPSIEAERIMDMFGRRSYKWYCVDMTSPVYIITYSDKEAPRTLEFKGVPTQIVMEDRAPFELRIVEVDLIRLELRKKSHPSCIRTENA